MTNQTENDLFDFTFPVSAEEQKRFDRVEARHQQGMCGQTTLCPDDLIRRCVLPKGHSGFCDGGIK